MSENLTAYTLFSSSKGNCAFVKYKDSVILIDAGVSARSVNKALSEFDLSLSDVGGILITHEHSDHIKGLNTIAKNYKIPMYCPYLCIGEINRKCPATEGLLFESDNGVELFGMKVYAFPTPHDAIGSVCYRIETPDGIIGYATDIGHFTPEIGQCILNCDAVVLESNHDLEMLKNGPYPFPLKKRIAGEFGHLSNKSCSTALPKAVQTGARRMVLAHLSPENNRPALAYSCAKGSLISHGINIGESESDRADASLAVASPAGAVKII